MPLEIECPTCGKRVPIENYSYHYRTEHGEEAAPPKPKPVKLSATEYEKKVYANVIVSRLWNVIEKDQEEQAKKYGFSSLKEYKQWQEQEYARRNSFAGIVIGECYQDNIFNAYKYALEDPKVMPKGMTDPIDWAMSDYGDMKWDDRGRWTGYRSTIPKQVIMAQPLVDRVFPTGNYDLDYDAVKALIAARLKPSPTKS